MIYFLWSLLNLGALVWFLLICFGALKLIRQEFGMIAMVIFVLGCLSFISNSVSNNKQAFPADADNPVPVIDYQNVQESMFYKVDLMYIKPKNSLVDNTRGITLQSGFVIGHDWQPGITKVFAKGGNWNYNAEGIHEWKFLGLTLYKEPVILNGAIVTK